MSLTYHSEHLAWQQRVHQEKNRTENFNKTFSTFSIVDEAQQTGRSVFPKANQSEKPINYYTLKYNLAYSFGGTKPIRSAIKDQENSSASKQATADSFNRSTAKTASESPRKSVKSAENSPKKLRSLKSLNPTLAKLDQELQELKLNASRTSFDEAGEIYTRGLEKKLSKERRRRIKLELALEKARNSKRNLTSN